MRVTSDVGPWTIVPEWVLDAEISDRAVRLYGLLGRYADANGESFASRRKLAERLRCSVDSVDRAMAELRAVGALTSDERHRENGGQSANLITLRMAAPVHTPLGTGAAPPLGTGAEGKNESHKKRETSMAATPRKRNDVWDALTYVFGEPTVPTAIRLRGQVCRDLTNAGATKDQVVARASAWPAHFDQATLTDTALRKHWDTLGRKPLRRAR